jgi:phospholipid/cholesterol/gamma-HCH transport system substrate-binding protein
MPRTRSLAWSELKLGVLTIAAIIIAAATIFLVTGGKGFFWQRYALKTRFANVAGLKPGSPVRLAGVELGSVTSVDLVGEQVDVTFEVNKDFRDRITSGSRATLGSVSLLGESAIDITPSSQGTPIPEWGYVPQGKTAPQLSDVTDQASQGINELTGLIHDVRAGKGTVGKLMTDDQLYAELHAFVVSANDLATGLRRGNGTIGKLLKDPKTADALEASLKNIQDVTGRIAAGQGSLGKLLNDDAFATSLSGATANLRELTGKINSGEGTVGRLMTDRALYDRISDATNRLDELVTRLNDGQGTAGQLLKDQRLYENMNKVALDLSSLLTAIKQDPKRYLNVKVSIF